MHYPNQIREHVAKLIERARRVRQSAISREGYKGYVAAARRAHRSALGLSLAGLRNW